MVDDIQTPQDSAETSPETTISKESDIQAAIDEKYPNAIVKQDKRLISRPFPKPTELTVDQENELLDDIVNSKSMSFMIRKYRLSEKRINNISNKRIADIDRKRCEMLIKHQKEFIPKAIIKRTELLNAITEKKIEEANIAQITGSIHDLTIDTRLEMDKSTVNAEIISKDTSVDDLKSFIINGSVNNVTTDK